MIVEWIGFDDEIERPAITEAVESRYKNCIEVLFPYFGLNYRPREVRRINLAFGSIEEGEYLQDAITIKSPTFGLFLGALNQNITPISSYVVHETCHHLHHLSNPSFCKKPRKFIPSSEKLSRNLHLFELVPEYAECLYWDVVGKGEEYIAYLKTENSEYRQSGMRLYQYARNFLPNLAKIDEHKETFHPFLDSVHRLAVKEAEVLV